MKKTLAILGAGGHARVVADSALESGWESIVFFDNAAVPDSLVFGRWPLIGDRASAFRLARNYSGVISGFGQNRTRLRESRELELAGGVLVSVVHPRAIVSAAARLERGSVVFAGAVIQAGSVVGSAVIVNTGATIDHDCVLADGVHVCPGAHLGGGVTVGECGWIGIGAAVRQGVVIGEDAIVGVGAAVVKDVVKRSTVVGVPARPISEI